MMTREECMEIEFTTSHKISMIGFVILLVILVWGIISKAGGSATSPPCSLCS